MVQEHKMPKIKLLVEGGDMKPGPAIAQQLGPMGVNMGKVLSEVNSATKRFKGMTVPVNLNIDSKTKEFKIKVLSPPTSELIKKELEIEKASGERKKIVVGNISIEQIISITKTKYPSMLSKNFLSALKSVIGTCMALGVLIENKDPKEILEDIEKGKYKKEIETKKTELSPGKRKALKEFFQKIEEEQQAALKAEEEAKAAEEEAKAKEEAGEEEKEEEEEAAEEKKPEEETEEKEE
jgi:large subunit ribosomal protein L11